MRNPRRVQLAKIEHPQVTVRSMGPRISGATIRDATSPRVLNPGRSPSIHHLALYLSGEG